MDYIKYAGYGIIALASLKTLGIDPNIPPNLILPLFVCIAVGVALFCLLTSQAMDFLRWQEADTEQSNTRNEFVKEMRSLRDILLKK